MTTKWQLAANKTGGEGKQKWHVFEKGGFKTMPVAGTAWERYVQVRYGIKWTLSGLGGWRGWCPKPKFWKESNMFRQEIVPPVSDLGNESVALICPPDLFWRGKEGVLAHIRLQFPFCLQENMNVTPHLDILRPLLEICGFEYRLYIKLASIIPVTGYMLHLSPYWNDIASVQLFSHIACPFYDNKNVT